MKLLAFDTSTGKGGVAVLQDDRVLSQKVWDRDVSHGELLTPALQDCLAEANLNSKDLDALAIGNGPGSFTGVRITVNAAKALGYALNKPVFVYDTAEILAAGVERNDLPLVVGLNAHKNLLFTALYSATSTGWTKTRNLAVTTVDEFEKLITTPHICVGDGFDEFETQISPRLKSNLVRDPGLSDEPIPEILAKLALRNHKAHPPLVWKDVQALYIRASGAEEKLSEKLR